MNVMSLIVKDAYSSMLLGMTVIFPKRGLTADSIRWASYPEYNIATYIITIQKIPRKIPTKSLSLQKKYRMVTK